MKKKKHFFCVAVCSSVPVTGSQVLWAYYINNRCFDYSHMIVSCTIATFCLCYVQTLLIHEYPLYTIFTLHEKSKI